jgi:hypothetical protein
MFKTKIDVGSCSPDELRRVIEGQNKEIVLLRKTNKVLLELFSQNQDLREENAMLKTNVNQLSVKLDELGRQINVGSEDDKEGPKSD